MSTQQEFEKWLSECPVEYYQAFGNNTYMFLVPSGDDVSECDEQD